MPGARRTHCLACKTRERTQANTFYAERAMASTGLMRELLTSEAKRA